MCGTRALERLIDCLQAGRHEELLDRSMDAPSKDGTHMEIRSRKVMIITLGTSPADFFFEVTSQCGLVASPPLTKRSLILKSKF